MDKGKYVKCRLVPAAVISVAAAAVIAVIQERYCYDGSGVLSPGMPFRFAVGSILIFCILFSLLNEVYCLGQNKRAGRKLRTSESAGMIIQIISTAASLLSFISLTNLLGAVEFFAYWISCFSGLALSIVGIIFLIKNRSLVCLTFLLWGAAVMLFQYVLIWGWIAAT